MADTVLKAMKRADPINFGLLTYLCNSLGSFVIVLYYAGFTIKLYFYMTLCLPIY